MSKDYIAHLSAQIDDLKQQGLFKEERVMISPQAAVVQVEDAFTPSHNSEVINFCANNYLGLANHPVLIKAGQEALAHYGFGLSSVRFICGTQDIHKKLEASIAHFLGMEDAILYSSCFDANGGLFETLLGPEDAIISDALNHASIIDGIRLCKAKRFVYANNDMNDLEQKLKAAESCRFKLVATDGVFSMDGTFAPLKDICRLSKQYGALTMVDDSHAVGFIGEKGRGTHEYWDVMGDVDIITGTLGKALGGASGGYTAAKREVVTWLRQRSRPYLFSNTLAPVITAVSLSTLELLSGSDALRKQLHENAAYFRAGLESLGFQLIPGSHPIIPIMLGDANLAKNMAAALLKRGVYVVGFSYPVVPQGRARLRIQISAAHTRAHLDKALLAFEAVGREFGVLK